MQPVGLTLKRTKKKYGPTQDGEVMLIHLCKECGKISINRVAADDDPYQILSLYQNSLKTAQKMKLQFCQKHIQVLTAVDKKIVQMRLFGKSILEESVRDVGGKTPRDGG
jgi:hypothetical protein